MNNNFKLLSAMLAGAFVLAFTSCKKEPSPEPVTAPPAVTKIKEYKNGDEFIRFTYNADGSLQKATVKTELNTGNAEVDYTISYNAQKKISEVTNANGEKIVPAYDNGQMVRADMYDGQVKTGYTSYHYETGLLKRATIYLIQGAGFEPALEFIFTHDVAGNVSQTVAMMTNGVPGQLRRAGHVNIQYDLKANPLYEHKDFLALLWQAASKNNPINEDHFAADLTFEESHVYVYTYKANGLPEKATVTKGRAGQPPAVTALNFLYL